MVAAARRIVLASCMVPEKRGAQRFAAIRSRGHAAQECGSVSLALSVPLQDSAVCTCISSRPKPTRSFRYGHCFNRLKVYYGCGAVGACLRDCSKVAEVAEITHRDAGSEAARNAHVSSRAACCGGFEPERGRGSRRIGQALR
jgi:hypothetical protein